MLKSIMKKLTFPRLSVWVLELLSEDDDVISSDYFLSRLSANRFLAANKNEWAEIGLGYRLSNEPLWV